AVLGTFLDGRDLYSADDLPLSPAPVVVMGNEGAGISPEVEAVVTDRLRIPSFPPGRQTSESLNVAMATGIIISELSRRIYG
ncbi:MAG: RNA methyltransferase, partial [Muribaculaceae bacterium]|nr:RNA methyltransferase [Muribaculaceae bacterium]